MGEALGKTLGLTFILGMLAAGALTVLAMNSDPGLAVHEAFVGAALGLAGAVFGVVVGLIGIVFAFITTVFVLAVTGMSVMLATAPFLIILAAPIALVVIILWAASRG